MRILKRQVALACRLISLFGWWFIYSFIHFFIWNFFIKSWSSEVSLSSKLRIYKYVKVAKIRKKAGNAFKKICF